ncbi:MAG: family 78 glycoside hydrolase catalytic domain [Fimbriimonas sp.]
MGLAVCAFMVLSATMMASVLEPRSAMTPIDLRCENRVNPLGVDAAHPRLSWVLQGSGRARGRHQSAYRVLVSSDSKLLERNVGDLWDSGKRVSAEQNEIAYAGVPLKSGKACFWKVRVWEGKSVGPWSKPASWEMGLLQAKDWAGRWINDGKQSSSAPDLYADDPAPIFRKEFSVRKPVARARLAISGLGYYEASLNGMRVGDHVLDPGWTRFEKRVEYQVYEVRAQLSRGDNCLGILLGNGWYNPLPLKLFGSFNLREHLAIGRPRVIAQLRIEYADGSVQTVATNQTWRVGESAILRNSIYLGEVVDARKEVRGWDEAGYDDSDWRAPGLAKEKLGPLVAPSQPPIRVTATRPAVKVSQPKPGVYIYDLGVNFAGWVSLKLDVPTGTEIRMRYGELLYPDGALNPMTSVAGQIKGFKQGTKESIGGPGAPEIAWQADTYIARGGGETYTPTFTFHGFRYVEMTGLPEPLPLSSVTAMRLNSDVESVGSFECSNTMLNELQAMCRRTFLSNIFSVQSDCPHRERLGYGGDIVATSEAFMANFDMAGFYEKAVRDWSDSALPDGMFTDTAPFMGIQYCGVIWAMAHPLLIDQLYTHYGNRRIAEEEYAAAKRWLSLVEKRYPGGIVTDGLSDHEGLAPAPADAMVTPMYFQSAKLLAAIAKRLGRSEDETHFRQLAEKISGAYLAKFLDEATGKVGPGTQASQSFALYTGIVGESARAKVFDYLVKDIESRGNHLSTGILGTQFMLDVLSREGRADLAYAIVTQLDFPGWGWMLKNGATTLWEHWEFSDNTFSHNHPMFGSVSQWMMSWLGGIQPDAGAAGFDRIVIHPRTPAGLDWVKSSYRSVRGKIVSNWSRRGKKLRFEIEVPINTRALVSVPAKSVAAVTEGGKRLADVEGVSGVRLRGDSVELNVGSGRYLFSVDGA